MYIASNDLPSGASPEFRFKGNSSFCQLSLRMNNTQGTNSIFTAFLCSLCMTVNWNPLQGNAWESLAHSEAEMNKHLWEGLGGSPSKPLAEEIAHPARPAWGSNPTIKPCHGNDSGTLCHGCHHNVTKLFWFITGKSHWLEIQDGSVLFWTLLCRWHSTMRSCKETIN